MFIQLTDAQKEIYNITSGEHIIQAPAGCGKTEILTLRLTKALQDGIDAEKMICLTFTNRAAYEMKQRAGTDSQKVFIGNIHNFCSGFLKSNGYISTNKALLDDVEYKTIIKGLIKKFGENKPIEHGQLYYYLMDRKRVELQLKLMHPDRFSDIPLDLAKCYETIFQQYENIKLTYSLIDFDDLLSLTLYHLKNSVPQKMCTYEWIQIDEAQDLNPAQWQIIERISSNATCKLIFGDVEQSIFSFMGADQTAFKQRLNSGKNVHYLNQNFRSQSNPTLVNLLNLYLSKTIKSEVKFEVAEQIPSENDNFQLIQVPGTNTAENEYIIQSILSQLDTEKENTALIFRTNNSAEGMSKQLNERQIKHFKVSGQDFFDEKEIKDLKSYLQCLISPMDIISWSRMAHLFVSETSAEKARAFIYKALKSGVLPSDILLQNEPTIARFLDRYQNNRIIVFDTETTGLNTDEEDILQIAATEIINGKAGKSFEVYIQSDKWKAESEAVHHISQKTLNEFGLSPKTALEKFQEFLGGPSILVAHNADFDEAMLTAYLRKHGFHEKDFMAEVYDTLVVSRLLYPDFKKHKLENLLSELQLEGVNSHNAIDDVNALVNLIHRICQDLPQKIEDARMFLFSNENFIQKFKKQFADLFGYGMKLYLKDIPLSHLINYFSEQYFSPKLIEDKRLEKFLAIVRTNENEYPGMSLRTHLLEKLRDYNALREVDLIDKDIKIVVTTAHKAKGLSFDNVIIAEVVSDVYPSFFSKTPEAIAEEQRIFYVALSRSKNRIFITTHDTFITQYGNHYPRKISTFVTPILPYFKQINMETK